MKNLARVRTWNSTTYENTTALAGIFSDITLFQNIYIPVKTPNAQGMPEEYTYTNIGLTQAQLVEAYETYYGGNYLVEPLDVNQVSISVLHMNAKLKAIFNMNKGKYLKLIELGGYKYNPLWNVDGTEEYTYLENQGVNDTKVTYTTNARTDSNGGALMRTGNIENTYGNENGGDINTTSVTPFDSNQWQDTEKNVAKGNSMQTFNNVTDEDTRSITYGAHNDTTKTDVTHNNAKNGNDDYSGGTDTFGNVVVGGDMYHTEKRVRSGNIGVTKTQELIEAERENLKFLVVMEFFKDINEQVLVGIY